MEARGRADRAIELDAGSEGKPRIGRERAGCESWMILTGGRATLSASSRRRQSSGCMWTIHILRIIICLTDGQFAPVA